MMAEIDRGFEGDQETVANTSFSLLFGGDDDVVGLDLGQSFNYTCFSFPAYQKTPRMLCFGGYQTDAETVFGESAISTKKTSTNPRRSRVLCIDFSSASSGNKSNSVKKLTRNGDRELMQRTGAIDTTLPTSQRTNKRSKVETCHAKVRKEKLGDRITALQQLVSLFGKIDTTLVLHEAMGYIRFLHNQVQVLYSPYLQHLPDGRENGGEESRNNLKSRGLCLVPVACTLHVANSNGVDFWSIPKVFWPYV